MSNIDAPSTANFNQAFIENCHPVTIASRSGSLIWPQVNQKDYGMYIMCDCPDLVLLYKSDRPSGWFYSNCAKHGLQPQGRAIKTQLVGATRHFGGRKRRTGHRM